MKNHFLISSKKSNNLNKSFNLNEKKDVIKVYKLQKNSNLNLNLNPILNNKKVFKRNKIY